MSGEKRSRKPFWAGVAVGFVLGIFATLGGLLGLGLWAAHVMQERGVVGASGLPAPDLPGPTAEGAPRAGTGTAQGTTAPGRTAPLAAWGRLSYRGRVEDLDGRPLEFNSLKDHVAVVHVWATWYGPCVQELPQIQALSDSLRRAGVIFLAISEEDPAKVRAFLARRRLRLPAYVAAGALPEEFRSDAIPATFIVRKNGVIVVKHVGAAAWDSESARRFIRGLL